MPTLDQPMLIQWLLRIMRFASNLLKSIWLFFPAILFIFLTFACFITLEQGRDIVISFTENTRQGPGIGPILVNILIKLTFFVAIAFWAYVSWFSSRIVAYAKLYRQKTYASAFQPAIPESEFSIHYEVQQLFLDTFPRLVGYACFIIMLFALCNLVFPHSIVKKQPLPCLAGCLLIVGLLDRRLIKFTSQEASSARLRLWFRVTGITFLVLLLVLQVTGLLNSAWVLFIMVFLLMGIYMLYINLRRKIVEEDAAKTLLKIQQRGNGIIALLKNVMNFIHLDQKEFGYFLWFNVFAAFGLLAYIAAIVSYPVAVGYGPLPLVLLAFAVLLGFGNIVTVLSVKTGINFHFIIFLIAAIFPNPETHYARVANLNARQVDPNIYKNRQNIQEYFTDWLNHHPQIDSTSNYPVYFVLGNGGASRSAYWVASVLGRLQDNSIREGKERFSDHIFCLSGTSGGGVGVASFYTLVKHAAPADTSIGFEKAAKEYLGQDFLTYTLARMLGPDYFNYIPLINWIVPNADRVHALETAFETAPDKAHYRFRFDSTWFDQCISQKNTWTGMPILCINTTRVQDGNPAVVSSIQLDPKLFDRRVDLVNLLQHDTTLPLSTAAILGARFPYISPAGRIDQLRNKKASPAGTLDSTVPHFFVDGGYFDNSGAGVVQEMIRAMIKMAESSTDPVLRKRARNLRIVVLHITNSPQGDANIKEITAFKNDLSAPLLTILGAYDMQTTVNDMRLINYIADVDLRPDSLPLSRAVYYPIHLYSDPTEPGDTSRGPFAMNWFISDSVRQQMDRRLDKQPKLNRLLSSWH